VTISATGWWLDLRQDRTRREFWWPVLNTDQPALILVGRTNQPARANAAGDQPQSASSGPASSAGQASPGQLPSGSTSSGSGGFQSVALNDAILTAQVCGTFREQKRECTVARADQARVEDLRGKSVVLIGGFNNPWTLRLLTPLAYQIQINHSTQTAPQVTRLVVEQKPTGNIPLVTMGNEDPSSDHSKDYAIVARFHSDITDSMAVVVAGLGPSGTSSAGQYVSSPERLQEITSRAPKGWKGVNFEAVLQVDVIQGSAGHAQVIATRFW
jgi:hypothetical protein